MDFEEARDLVQKLGLRNEDEWRKYAKSKRKPPDIPSTPAATYKQQWISWGDWLGTGNVKLGKETRRSFENARIFAQSLQLSGESAWRIYVKSGLKPADIPAAPHKAYQHEGWLSWGDWLGTGNTRNKNWRTYSEAQQFVSQLNLRSETAWREYLKSGYKPDDIPSNPAAVYKDTGWKSWPHWLGKID